MRSFSEFTTSLDGAGIEAAEADRLGTLATWAYLLLRPGMEFVRQRSNFMLGWRAAAEAAGKLTEGVSAGAVGSAGVPPLGSWMMLPDLTTPATRTVLPSHDALYGAAHLELDLLGPVVLTVPPNIDERYFSVTVMDAHMNNVAHIGPRWTGNEGGDFLIVPPGSSGGIPEGMSVIQAPTVSICLYNRMLVEFAPGDIDRVREWQAGLKLTQLSKWGSADPTPDDVPTEAFVHPDINTMTDPHEYLAIGLAHLRRNPMVPEASWLSSLVLNAGLDGDPASTSLAQAVATGVDQATRMLDTELTTWPRVNGWMVPDKRLGLPNAEVLKSAAFQQFQIGSNDSQESLYYFADTDADGDALDASGGRTYLLEFDPADLPPHHSGGYWSLTMYGADSLLVANPEDRYVVRPGSPGYAPKRDGRVAIAMGTGCPDGFPRGMWLPAPEGRFRLGLRLYYPEQDAQDARWMPPTVRRLTT